MKKVITIDGPSASGKGTLAILLAERLNWKILDSGALYRAFAYFSISENDERLIERNLRKISFNIIDNSIQVLFKNEDISKHLRSEETAQRQKGFKKTWKGCINIFAIIHMHF